MPETEVIRTVNIPLDEYSAATLQLMLNKLRVGGLGSDDYVKLANWAKFLEGQFIMQAAVQGGAEQIERIKNSDGGGFGPSFKQLDMELSKYK